MTDTPLDVFEIGAGRSFIFGGVYAANDGFFAEVHEQKNGHIRRIAQTRGLPSREVAVAWMTQRCQAGA